MPRSPSLSRDKPLKRSQIEETLTIKPSTKKNTRKRPSESVPQPKLKKKKSNKSVAKVTKTSTAKAKTQVKTGIMHLILPSLIQVNIPGLALSVTSSPSQTSRDNTSESESTRQVIDVLESTPPPPPLPLIELVIIFIINGKETGERSLEIDVNQEFKSFNLNLLRLCKAKLPSSLSFASEEVDLSYKRAYVTKAQEAKRKDLNWKDFADEQDYSGVRNAIRNSKPSKMTLMVRAFLTIPKEDFEAEIEPTIASQRVVEFPLIRVDNRVLQLCKSRL